MVFMSMFLQHSCVAILIPKVVELGDRPLGRRFELDNRALMIGVSGSIEETHKGTAGSLSVDQKTGSH